MKQTVELHIELEPHISWARRVVGRLAHSIGFAREGLDEIDVCVRELASNMLAQSAQGGRLRAEEISQGAEQGIEISIDSNGSSNASQDGYDALIRSMAAAQSLADEFHIYSSRNHRQVVFRKYLPSNQNHPLMGRPEFVVSVEVRNHPSSVVCGDGHVIAHDGPLSMLAVIDGLGHGEKAKKAAAAAERFLLDAFPEELSDVPGKLHRVLSGSRGVSVGIALIDHSKDRLQFAGVGNITVRLKYAGENKWMRPVCVPGALGQILPRVDVMSFPWSRGSILVMHTDGIKPGWELSSPQLSLPSADIARLIMETDWGGCDDATVMVAK